LGSAYINRKWKDILWSHSPAGWCAKIKETSPAALVNLLGRERAPTFDEVEALEWFDCEDAGDYGHTVGEMGKKNMLYGGSASSTTTKLCIQLKRRPTEHEQPYPE
jgi:hypothetical protein